MPADINAQLSSIAHAFEEFKAANDEKLKAKADVVLTEKVDRISAAVGDLQASIDASAQRLAALDLAAGQPRRVRDPEHSEAFLAHMRRGEVRASLNKATDSEGGYLAPVEWDRTITDKLVITSPMRRLAGVQTVTGTSFSKLFNLRGTASGWVGETAARAETAGPAFGSMTIATGEVYANPSATQQILDDALVDLESWLAAEVETEFAYQEGVAFISGNGTNRPNGLLTYVTGAANAAANPLGAITLTNSGNAALITADGVVNLVHALPSAFTGNAAFIANRSTIAAIRKLKDGQGNYLWQPSFTAGQPQTISGYPVEEMAAMPDVAANAKPLVFGDFRRGYLIVDRAGIRLIRDNVTNKPYVMFYTTKRVGGAVVNPEALKAMTIAA